MSFFLHIHIHIHIAIECESFYVLDIFQIHLSCFLMVLSFSLNLSLVGDHLITLITCFKFSYVSHESSGYSLVVFFNNMSDSVSGSPADLSWTAKKCFQSQIISLLHLRNSAFNRPEDEQHYLPLFVVCPASVTSPLISTI